MFPLRRGKGKLPFGSSTGSPGEPVRARLVVAPSVHVVAPSVHVVAPSVHVVAPSVHAVRMSEATETVDRVTVVYTDGACLGNPGPGGWGWAVDDRPSATPAFDHRPAERNEGLSGSGSDPHTTNQRMEITAVVEALRAIDGDVHVVSDSTYVVNCFLQTWWAGWKRRGWRNSQGKPVANRDLWEALFGLALDGGRQVTFEWVKGHSGDPMNDRVDQLATEAAANQRGSRGSVR
ncbi:MAG: ribonuclease H family protein [Acidimicrobiales bacterium]